MECDSAATRRQLSDEPQRMCRRENHLNDFSSNVLCFCTGSWRLNSSLLNRKKGLSRYKLHLTQTLLTEHQGTAVLYFGILSLLLFLLFLFIIVSV
jgi:hypothetical protein